MKNAISFFTLFLLLSCGNSDADPGRVAYPDSSGVLAFMVDYTTTDFLGGYMVDVPQSDSPMEMSCDYVSPSDFGSVVWRDKATDINLFSGTIVWRGKGQRTFPKDMYSPSLFRKSGSVADMPVFTHLLHDVYDVSDKEVDYASIWKSIEDLENTSWVNPETPACIYLYRPSVGEGNPQEWYWVIFLRYG